MIYPFIWSTLVVLWGGLRRQTRGTLRYPRAKLDLLAGNCDFYHSIGDQEHSNRQSWHQSAPFDSRVQRASYL